MGERVSLIEKYLLAEDMRRNPTKSEAVLDQVFAYIDGLAITGAGYGFLRQEVIAGYIVDFVCFELKLIVEVDGSSHQDRQQYDAFRDAALKRHGFRVVRISSEEVLGPIYEWLEWTKNHGNIYDPDRLPGLILTIFCSHRVKAA